MSTDAFDAVPFELRPSAAPTGDEVLQNVADLYADMQRDREEHGPRLRELRCTEAASNHLAALWPEAPERKPWEPLLAVPVLEDEDIPVGILRLVYDDGTTKDVIVNAEQYLAGLAAELLNEPIEIKPPPMPNRFSDIYRYGAIVQPTNYSPIWGINA